MWDKYLESENASLRSSVAVAICLVVMLPALVPDPARADTNFEWAGFGTVGIGLLDDDSINESNPVPHNGYEEDLRGDVDTRLGLQGTVFFDNAFGATLQVAADSASDDDAEVEWLYLSYDFSESLKLRAGRLRKPLYANSDFLPVGYIYPWARPPLEVYSRDIQIYDGVDAFDLLYRASAANWDFTTEVYFGGSDGTSEIGPDEEKGDYETNDDFGVVIEAERNWLTLRFGYHRSPDVTVETSDDLEVLYAGLEAAGFSGVADDMETSGIEVEFYNLGATIDFDDWLLAAEYVHLPVADGLAPDETSWYVTGGRRFGAWTLHLTYAERKRDSDDEFSEPIRRQAAIIGPPFNAGLLTLAGGVDQAEEALKMDLHSYTLGARYDFKKPVTIKAEYQYIVDDRFDLSNNLVSVIVDFLF